MVPNRSLFSDPSVASWHSAYTHFLHPVHLKDSGGVKMTISCLQASSWSRTLLVLSSSVIWKFTQEIIEISVSLKWYSIFKKYQPKILLKNIDYMPFLFSYLYSITWAKKKLYLVQSYNWFSLRIYLAILTLFWVMLKWSNNLDHYEWWNKLRNINLDWFDLIFILLRN